MSQHVERVKFEENQRVVKQRGGRQVTDVVGVQSASARIW